MLVAYVNTYERKLEEITEERVKAYDLLDEGRGIFNGGPTRKKPERMKLFATGLHRVELFEADEGTQTPFLKRQRGVGDVLAGMTPNAAARWWRWGRRRGR
jgi:hypothetical protein